MFFLCNLTSVAAKLRLDNGGSLCRSSCGKQNGCTETEAACIKRRPQPQQCDQIVCFPRGKKEDLHSEQTLQVQSSPGQSEQLPGSADLLTAHRLLISTHLQRPCLRSLNSVRPPPPASASVSSLFLLFPLWRLIRAPFGTPRRDFTPRVFPAHVTSRFTAALKLCRTAAARKRLREISR